MTRVPDLIRVVFATPLGNSDQSSLLVVISMRKAVPKLCVSMKVFLKHQVNWKTVRGAVRDLPWRNIWFAGNAVDIFSEQFPLLVGRFVATKIIRVRNKDKPEFNDDCRHVFDLQHNRGYLRWIVDRTGVIWD